MSDDYYSPHPRLVLRRPLVIGGQLGCGARSAGRILCGLTALPFVEIDRQIEHEAGRSLARLSAELGAERLESLAAAALEHQVSRRPHAVIVLDRVWPAVEAAPLLRDRVDFAYVKRDAAALWEPIAEELRRAGVWVLGTAACDVALLASDEAERLRFLAHRKPLLGRAGILVEAADDHPNQIASRLVECLEHVAGAQPV